ncbi:hypothetical protein GCM10010104_56380 [Streptomyces indiaensis]|uniref:Uncharacterized protein n=1 Tax=Streptomyces indiaensis TaxID=284033 RepID=A0ABN3E9U6_9ACTN
MAGFMHGRRGRGTCRVTRQGRFPCVVEFVIGDQSGGVTEEMSQGHRGEPVVLRPVELRQIFGDRVVPFEIPQGDELGRHRRRECLGHRTQGESGVRSHRPGGAGACHTRGHGQDVPGPKDGQLRAGNRVVVREPAQEVCRKRRFHISPLMNRHGYGYPYRGGCG